jgi:ribosomal protein S18 acetylase RimI-like enzyme
VATRTTPDPAVRPLRPEDVDAVVALSLPAWEPVFAAMRGVLGDRLFHRYWPDWRESQAADVRRECTDPAVDVLVAVGPDDVPVGFASLVHPETGTGELHMIAVDPAAQRNGAARALVRGVVGLAREKGCTLVTIATGGDEGHAPARALYESEGFTGLPQVC